MSGERLYSNSQKFCQRTSSAVYNQSMKCAPFVFGMMLLFQSVCFAQVRPKPQALQRAEAASAALQNWYVDQTGLYATTGWWNAANAVTTMVDLTRAGGSGMSPALLARTFKQAQVVVPKSKQTGALIKMTGAPGFLNDYYDDEGWWALAWIDAYDLTSEPRYLAMAQSIFADMSGGWDSTCGGGIWWSKDRNYKNAIANELFLSVAAHLAVRVKDSRYADWAEREWSWFQSSSMINSEHLVNDGLTVDKITGSCQNNGRTVWTYNQGVLLGALAEWTRLKPNPMLLLEARVLADAGLAHLTDNAGILHDVCEPAACGADATQFKGIFVRNLRALDRLVHEPRYAAFFRTNAESVWSNDRSPGDRLGLVWSGPATAADAATQSSALDVLVAALPDRR